jgi:hypothetical protein
MFRISVLSDILHNSGQPSEWVNSQLVPKGWHIPLHPLNISQVALQKDAVWPRIVSAGNMVPRISSESLLDVLSNDRNKP